jgi:hypothetical protein
MKARVFITITVLCVYVIGFNFYLYELTHHFWSHRQKTLLYNTLTLSMLLFYFLDLKTGIVSYFHEQFNNVCYLSVIINFIIIILTHLTILEQPLFIFISFNSGMFIATLMLAIAGARHGTFNN